MSVDRGESVDVGELCFVAASSGDPAPAPAPAPDGGDVEDGELAATGGGAAAIAVGLLALAGFALAGRHRDELV